MSMVSAFFQCSSPYIGYTIKKADYKKNEMVPCNRNNRMELGNRPFETFTSSGSLFFLGNIDGKRYFHTRQSKTDNYDEQNRRIYTNIAFVAENQDDFNVINRLAAYVFFEEKQFYSEIAKMITLLDDGFKVDFEKFSEYLKRFESDLEIETTDAKAKNIFNNVFLKNNKNEICLIVPETTLDNFFSQMKYNFKNDVLEIVTAEEQSRLAETSSVSIEEQHPVSIVEPPVVIGELSEGDDKEDGSQAKKPIENEHEKEDESDKKLSDLSNEVRKNKEKINELNGIINELRAKVEGFAEMGKKDKTALIKNVLIAVLGVAVTVLLTLLIKG